MGHLVSCYIIKQVDGNKKRNITCYVFAVTTAEVNKEKS